MHRWDMPVSVWPFKVSARGLARRPRGGNSIAAQWFIYPNGDAAGIITIAGKLSKGFSTYPEITYPKKVDYSVVI